MATPDERTSLLAAVPFTREEPEARAQVIDPRILQVAADLVEAVHSDSKDDTLERSDAAVWAARIRSQLRAVDRYALSRAHLHQSSN